MVDRDLRCQGIMVLLLTCIAIAFQVFRLHSCRDCHRYKAFDQGFLEKYFGIEYHKAPGNTIRRGWCPDMRSGLYYHIRGCFRIKPKKYILFFRTDFTIIIVAGINYPIYASGLGALYFVPIILYIFSANKGHSNLVTRSGILLISFLIIGLS